MFFNPSLLTFHEGNQLVTVGNVIFPEAEFKNGSASFTPAVGGGALNPAPGFSGNTDIGRTAFVPATYAMISPTEDLRLGLALTAPFGLKTSNEEGWIGR